MFDENAEELKPRGHFARYRQIVMVLGKYKLEEVLRYIGLEKFLVFRWLIRGNPWRKIPHTRPESIRLAIEELGTFFVKLGQILSTRTDLLPPPYTAELSKLQNSLKPLHAEVMQKVIYDELGRSTDELFKNFNPEPVGVASIGQVYACTLLDGTEAVVKVQKPGVPELIEEDMFILNRAATAAAKRWKGAEQYDLVGIAQEISDTIKMETDYVNEGRNAEYFSRFFQDEKRIHIPRIFWEFTSERVLTMERIQGIKILDIQALDQSGFNRKDLATRSVDLWLKMVFEGETYHADPHPGNLFVEPDGRLALVDFGMAGMIDDEVRWNLVNTLKSIMERDPDLLIDSLIELGAVNLREEGCRSCLRKDLKYMMVHFPSIHFDRSAEGINTSLGQLFTLLRRNRIQLPASTFMMLKTIIMAQAIGKGLDPEFDLFPMLDTHLKQIIRRKYSLSAAFSHLPSMAIELTSLAGELPQRINRLMKTVERGEIHVSTDVSGVEKHIHHLEHLVNRTLIGLIVVGLILGLALIFVGWQLGK